jgi:DnaJ-domain-containing protein 1
MGLFDRFRKAAAPRSDAEPARAADAPCRRSAERFPTTVLTCLLGSVCDLSRTGMRVVSQQPPPVPPGTLFEFEIHSPTSDLTVIGRIARAARLPTGGFDVGIEFQRVTPELAEALESLAQSGKVRKRSVAADAAGAKPVTASVNLPDLYGQLGVDERADERQIHHAYREMARKYHPDVNKSDEAYDRFLQISRAYEVLRDAEKRQAYDQARAARRNAA